MTKESQKALNELFQLHSTPCFVQKEKHFTGFDEDELPAYYALVDKVNIERERKHNAEVYAAAKKFVETYEANDLERS